MLLEPETYYHIYNRANGFENLFAYKGNYEFFLKKTKQYLDPVLNLHAYCLMPNHFHFLIRTKTKEEIMQNMPASTKFEKLNRSSHPHPKFETLDGDEYKTTMFQTLDGDEEEAVNKQVSYYISKQFSNLFSSYTQAFNKQQKRKGNLFQKGFKRKEVDSEDYLKQLVLYIHCNAVHHRFVKDFVQWEYISYHAILKNIQSEVIRWFDDLDNFIAFHRNQTNFFNIENLIIE